MERRKEFQDYQDPIYATHHGNQEVRRMCEALKEKTPDRGMLLENSKARNKRII